MSPRCVIFDLTASDVICLMCDYVYKTQKLWFTAPSQPKNGKRGAENYAHSNMSAVQVLKCRLRDPYFGGMMHAVSCFHERFTKPWVRLSMQVLGLL